MEFFGSEHFILGWINGLNNLIVLNTLRKQAHFDFFRMGLFCENIVIFAFLYYSCNVLMQFIIIVLEYGIEQADN